MYTRYKYHISVRREDGSLHNVTQKSRGDTSPSGCLARGFAALGQMVRDGDRSFIIEIKERGSGVPAFKLSSALPFLED